MSTANALKRWKIQNAVSSCEWIVTQTRNNLLKSDLLLWLLCRVSHRHAMSACVCNGIPWNLLAMFMLGEHRDFCWVKWLESHFAQQNTHRMWWAEILSIVKCPGSRSSAGGIIDSQTPESWEFLCQCLGLSQEDGQPRNMIKHKWQQFQLVDKTYPVEKWD